MTTINIINHATVVEFTASVELADGQVVAFNPSRPSKTDCIAIGWAYFDAATNEDQMDTYLAELGPVLVRRSLRAFANYAKRNGQAAVAKFSEELREDIEITHAVEDEDDESMAV